MSEEKRPLALLPWHRLEEIGIKRGDVTGVSVPEPHEMNMLEHEIYEPESVARMDEKGIWYRQRWFRRGENFYLSGIKLHTKEGQKVVVTKDFYGSLGEGIKTEVARRAWSAAELRAKLKIENAPVSIPETTGHEGTIIQRFVEGTPVGEKEFNKFAGKLRAIAKKLGFTVMLDKSNFIKDGKGNFHWVDVFALRSREESEGHA